MFTVQRYYYTAEIPCILHPHFSNVNKHLLNSQEISIIIILILNYTLCLGMIYNSLTVCSCAFSLQVLFSTLWYELSGS